MSSEPRVTATSALSTRKGGSLASARRATKPRVQYSAGVSLLASQTQASAHPLDGPTAAILLIGEELLSGKVEDENARFMVKALRSLGVLTRRIEVVPDEREEIVAAVRALSARFTHVFTAGGVGSTHDDVTMPSVAEAFSMPLVRHHEMAELIRRTLGAAFSERDLRMADLPSGAKLHYGPPENQMVWPVVAVKNVFVLPGVPSILQRKFGLIADQLRTTPIFARALYINQTEGHIAHHLDAVVMEFPAVSIGSYPHIHATDYQVKVTLDGRGRAEVDAALGALLARLGTVVVRVD